MWRLPAGGCEVRSARRRPQLRAGGVSIAFGPQWQPSQQSATSQTAWQLDLTQPYSSSATTSEVLISIDVQPEHLYRDPSVFQSKYEQMLKSMGGSPRSITLSGVPAVYWKGVSGYGVALTCGGQSYVLMAQIPSGGDSQERPQVLAVLKSFKLLPSPSSDPQAAPSSPSARPTAASSRLESEQYVVQLGPVIVAFDRQLASVGKAQDPWNAQDVSTWPAYRKATEVAVSQFFADEVKLEAISPPSSFKDAHAQLTRCISELRASYAYLGARLQTGQSESQWMSKVVARFTTAHETLVRFRA